MAVGGISVPVQVSNIDHNVYKTELLRNKVLACIWLPINLCAINILRENWSDTILQQKTTI